MSPPQDPSGEGNTNWEEVFFNEDHRGGDPHKIRPVDYKSRIDLVCHFFSKGNSIPKIVDLLEERYDIEGLTRELPYTDIATAVKEGFLRYRPSSTMRWTTQLRTVCPSLREAWIPEYGGRMAVIAEAAELISSNILGIAKSLTKEYIQDFDFPNELGIFVTPRRSRKCLESSQDQTPWWRREVFEKIERDRKELIGVLDPEDRDPKPIPLEIEVRLGFSGGSTIGITTGEIGRVLEPQLEKWEKDLKKLALDTLKKNGMEGKLSDDLKRRRFKVKLKLLFVNIVPGFDTDPLNHPIASLTSMIDKHPEVASRAQLRCYSAAPFVDITAKRPKDPKEAPGPKEVENFVKKYGLDIIITSAASLSDPHSTFRNYFRGGEDPNDVVYKTLKRNHMHGDILWHPITDTQRLVLQKLDHEDRKTINFRPMTLLGLSQLTEQIQRGQDVVLVLAPCSYCGSPKNQVLSAILTQKEPLISHVVADRETIENTVAQL